MTSQPGSIVSTEGASRCPLCGETNRCAMAASTDDGLPCWCTRASFSAELLASVPDASRGVACICARCAGALPEPSRMP